MLFNTFIQTSTKSKEFDQLNYRYDNIIQPRNLFQFADGATAVTSSEYENQILLKVFTRWCNWSGMTIRVDKCKTFGIKKTVTRSVQFKPKLFLIIMLKNDTVLTLRGYNVLTTQGHKI